VFAVRGYSAAQLVIAGGDYPFANYFYRGMPSSFPV
jgi:hypothetical protein